MTRRTNRTTRTRGHTHKLRDLPLVVLALVVAAAVALAAVWGVALINYVDALGGRRDGQIAELHREVDAQHRRAERDRLALCALIDRVPAGDPDVDRQRRAYRCAPPRPASAPPTPGVSPGAAADGRQARPPPPQARRSGPARSPSFPPPSLPLAPAAPPSPAAPPFCPLLVLCSIPH